MGFIKTEVTQQNPIFLIMSKKQNWSFSAKKSPTFQIVREKNKLSVVLSTIEEFSISLITILGWLNVQKVFKSLGYFSLGETFGTKIMGFCGGFMILNTFCTSVYSFETPYKIH